MQITEQHSQQAEAYSDSGMSADRKASIMQHIRDTPVHRRQELINQLASAPGQTRKFILYVFGPVADKGAAPQNKAVTPPTTV